MIETKFKHTEIGLIPHDWEVKELDEIAVLINGRAYSQSELLTSGKYKVLRVGNFFSNDSWYYSDLELDEKMYCSKGDLLYAWSCTYGAYIWNEPKTIFHYHIWKVLPINVDKNYLFFILNNDVEKQRKSSQGSTMSHITKGFMEKHRFILPPTIAEQKRIADALSKIDSLITDLDALIEKKRAIKTGTMQQLITGKKRLKGFTEEWVEKTMGEIGYTYSGLAGKKSSDFGEGNAQYITFLNILNNPIIDTTLFEKVKVAQTEKQNKVNRNDIFFNTSSETPEEVGICAVLDDDIDDLYLNSFCFGFRITDEAMSGKFLAYFWRSKQGREIMTALAQGATRYNLSKVYFNSAKIKVPTTIKEQEAIVNVLSSMDTEIAALEQKRDKYIAIKQGMMQNLLTGKIRLV